jgi:hypothetical protein
MIYGAGVFALVAIVPTALALWFIRRHRPAWSVFTIACVAFGIIGLGAALATIMTRGGRQPMVAWELVSLLGLAGMLASPIGAAGFALLAWLAPDRDLRRRMVVATGLEVAVGGCALLYFLLSASPL